jgi:hypothetical protein
LDDALVAAPHKKSLGDTDTYHLSSASAETMILAIQQQAYLISNVTNACWYHAWEVVS